MDAAIRVRVRAGHTTINLGVLWARPRPTEADEWAEVGKVHDEERCRRSIRQRWRWWHSLGV